MTKYQILLTIFHYLDEEFDKNGCRTDGFRQYLSELNPYLWTDGKTADPAYYADFMEITDELFSGDECTAEEGFGYAAQYLSELARREHDENGLDLDEVVSVFSGCTPEKWLEIAEKLCENRTKKRKCVCCGYYTLEEPEGGYEICPVCFWEDDPIQNCDPEFAGGANKVCLNEARRNFEELGACTESAVPFVRDPDAEEVSGIVSPADDNGED